LEQNNWKQIICRRIYVKVATTVIIFFNHLKKTIKCSDLRHQYRSELYGSQIPTPGYFPLIVNIILLKWHSDISMIACCWLLNAERQVLHVYSGWDQAQQYLKLKWGRDHRPLTATGKAWSWIGTNNLTFSGPWSWVLLKKR
jgi:hypothetical protein